MTKHTLNYVFATSSHEALSPDLGDRRFSAIDLDKIANARQHAAHLQAHADYLTKRQRDSGVRVRLCSTGCYSMYNAQGNFIGRSAPAGTLTGLSASALRTAAARMAYSEEMANTLRLVDLDYERNGTISPATVDAIRTLFSVIGAV